MPREYPIVEDPADDRLADYVGLSDRDIARRQESERFLVAEGPEVVRRLVASGLRIRSIVLSPNRVADMSEALAATDAPVFLAERAVMSRVVGFDLHRGVVASADRPPPNGLDLLERIRPADGSALRLAVLEGLNDHENLGAIARSARAFGIDALVLDRTCADPYYRRTVRVSMGEILFLPVVRAEPADVVAWIAERHGTSIALTPRSDAIDLDSVETNRGPTALILGAEGDGLTERTMSLASVRARIDIEPDVDSLNVGHAASVAFAQLRRRSNRRRE